MQSLVDIPYPAQEPRPGIGGDQNTASPDRTSPLAWPSLYSTSTKTAGEDVWPNEGVRRAKGEGGVLVQGVRAYLRQVHSVIVQTPPIPT